MSLSDRLAALTARAHDPRIARDIEAIAHQLARAEQKILKAAKGTAGLASLPGIEEE